MLRRGDPNRLRTSLSNYLANFQISRGRYFGIFSVRPNSPPFQSRLPGFSEGSSKVFSNCNVRAPNLSPPRLDPPRLVRCAPVLERLDPEERYLKSSQMVRNNHLSP